MPLQIFSLSNLFSDRPVHYNLIMHQPGVALLAVVYALATCTAGATADEGPCDILEAAGNPCFAAHSTTRALYASYKGPLYNITKQQNNKVTVLFSLSLALSLSLSLSVCVCVCCVCMWI